MDGFITKTLTLMITLFAFTVFGCESKLEITSHKTFVAEETDPEADVVNHIDKNKAISEGIDRQEEDEGDEPDGTESEPHPFVTIQSHEDSELIMFDNMLSYAVGGTCSESGQTVEISGPLTKATQCVDGLWSTKLDFSGVADGQLHIFADHSSEDGQLSPQASVRLIKHIQTEAMVDISYPASGKQAGWMVRLQGSCSNSGAAITIKDEAGLVDHVTVCEEQEWQAFIDLSAASTGLLALSVQHNDSRGIPAYAEPFEIKKITSACDDLAARSRTFSEGLAGGSGSLADPRVICTANQLFEIRFGDDSVNYILQNDIDFDYTDTNGDTLHNELDKDFVSGAGWIPAALTGEALNPSVFDGRGFEVRNLKINSSGGNNVGLFTDVSQRIIKNLFVLDANVNGESHGAIVATDCAHSGFYNVHATGQILVSRAAGGLCVTGSGFFIRTSVRATIQGATSAAGILALRAASGTGVVIAESYFSGTVTGSKQVGGISGDLGSIENPRLIINSHSSGTVKGNRQVGGLCGSYCDVRSSFSSADIVAGSDPDRYFGGIGGYGVTVYHSFTTGELDLETARDVGRIVGNDMQAGNNNYFWSLGSCTASEACREDGTGVESLSSFFDISTPPYLHWDFDGRSDGGNDNHWIAQEGGYPLLWWQESNEFAVPFFGGGTASNPYLISNAEELNRISSNSRWMGAVFDLTADIDLSALGHPHRPIALNSAFFGTLNGHGHHVANFNFINPERSGVGLIGNAVSASINNLHVINATVSGNTNVGTVVGVMTKTIVDGVQSFSGSSAGNLRVGGLVGAVGASRVERSSASSAVNGTDWVGGLLGYALRTSIFDSYATGDVTGKGKVGGLVGHDVWGSIRQSYAAGNVSGVSEVGGLVGFKSGNVGYNIRHSFALGHVIGDSSATDVGKLVGGISDEGGSMNNYVLATSDCFNGAIGCNDLISASLPSLEDFQDLDSAPLNSWDFESVWHLDLDIEPLPHLRF